jgi:hypothetical protein
MRRTCISRGTPDARRRPANRPHGWKAPAWRPNSLTVVWPTTPCDLCGLSSTKSWQCTSRIRPGCLLNVALRRLERAAEALFRACAKCSLTRSLISGMARGRCTTEAVMLIPLAFGPGPDCRVPIPRHKKTGGRGALLTGATKYTSLRQIRRMATPAHGLASHTG